MRYICFWVSIYVDVDVDIRIGSFALTFNQQFKSISFCLQPLLAFNLYFTSSTVTTLQHPAAALAVVELRKAVE